MGGMHLEAVALSRGLAHIQQSSEDWRRGNYVEEEEVSSGSKQLKLRCILKSNLK